MSNKSDHYIKMDMIYAEAVLKEAGYVEIETIYKGEIKKGYVRYSFANKRFHIYLTEDCLKIHVDKTINNKHVVVNAQYVKFLRIEADRIRKISFKYNQPVKQQPKKEKRKFKDMYAPNILELQKQNLNQGIVTKKQSFLQKVIHRLSTLVLGDY